MAIAVSHRFAPSGDLPVEAGRYRLVASGACPWCRRVLIARRLLGLTEAIPVSWSYGKGADGYWELTGPDGEPDRSGLLVLYSLSKQSNLAGYRAAFLAGDARLVGAVTEVRKHTGMLMPTPVQAALVAALGDEAHMEVQKEVYRERREVLVEATAAAGLVNDPASVAGLYLWLRGPESMSAYELVGAFAELGIVVAPGDFYGQAGAGRVRMSLTDTDERVAAAAARLRSPEAAALFAG